MNRSTPGLPVHHQLPEFTQTHVHRVGDAIQSSHPLSSSFPPAPSPSQHQGLSAMADKQNLTIELLQTWHTTPVLLPGKSHGQRRLVGCSPWGCEELDTTERLHFRFSLSCTGEGNGNPLQCSCLENPRDGGVCGVTQSQTQLKQLSSSSSRTADSCGNFIFKESQTNCSP